MRMTMQEYVDTSCDRLKTMGYFETELIRQMTNHSKLDKAKYTAEILYYFSDTPDIMYDPAELKPYVENWLERNSKC